MSAAQRSTFGHLVAQLGKHSDASASPPEPGSRLSCQIVLTPELDGLLVRVPASQH